MEGKFLRVKFKCDEEGGIIFESRGLGFNQDLKELRKMEENKTKNNKKDDPDKKDLFFIAGEELVDLGNIIIVKSLIIIIIFTLILE